MASCNDLSASRGFPRPRVPTGPVGRPRKYPKHNMFYSHPAELIAEWCCVALLTAFAYKSGRLKPGKPAAKLTAALDLASLPAMYCRAPTLIEHRQVARESPRFHWLTGDSEGAVD